MKPGPSRVTELGPSGVSVPGPSGVYVPEPSGVSVPGPSGVSVPGPSGVSVPGPSGVSVPGPSGVSKPGPSWGELPSWAEPGPGWVCEPGRVFEPEPSRVSEPMPGTSRKTDEELLLEHGIDRECRVVLSSAFVLDHGDSVEPTKGFNVHYGRHFLWHIAQLSWRHPRAPLDMDRLYSTFITSRFSSLDRSNFRGIMRSFFAKWERDYEESRAQLIKEQIEKVNARRKAEREAKRRIKITYRDQSVIVPRSNVEQAKIALRNSRKSRVVLERIFVADAPTDATAADGDSGRPDNAPVGSPQSATDVSESHTAPGSVSGDVEDLSELLGSSSSRSAISCSPPLCHFRYLVEENKEDRRTAIAELITDLIEEVSRQQDPDGGASNPDMSSTDCYSDDTLESPMEVEFESGESPDFSKVLRDSEETCHGDEFYEDATANQQSVPNSNADKGSSHQQKTITRSHDKPTVTKKPMKL